MLILTKKILLTEQVEEEITQTTDEYGNKIWRNKAGNLHNEDGPAIEYINGDKHWHKDGKYHRVDGPAVEFADGEKHWRQDGKLHRTDGPAIEYIIPRYPAEWWLNGEKQPDPIPSPNQKKE